MGFKLFFVGVAAAAIAFHLITSSTSITTCKEIADTTDIAIEWPSTPAYTADQGLYWSKSCRILLPSCILVPKTAQELSAIIKVLNNNKERFAVKSGGHNPNQYFSSILGGPLISLKGLDTKTYDAATGTALIGPGNRWADVAKALEVYGVAVAGGRIGHVGVGGYLTGGGLSYLSTQHGWAVNTVVEYEVVLANGDIVKASKNKNEDLYKVLKGGGNAFGIVTSFRLKAYPIGPVWGGLLIFVSPLQTDAILTAVQNFAEHYPDDRAALIATAIYNTTTQATTWVLFTFWDGPTPPVDLFSEIFAIGPYKNTWAQTTFHPFVDMLESSIITNEVISIGTETSPLPNATNGLEVFRSYYDYLVSTAEANKNVAGLTGQITYQAIPKRLAAKAKASGGDLLGLDPEHDLIVLELNWAYASSTDDKQMNKAIVTLTDGMRDRVNGFIKAGKLEKGLHLPLFMNDANFQQDYFGRLEGSTRKFVKKMQEKYDPDSFFKRTGGFK